MTSQLAAMHSERDELAAALERTEAIVEGLRGLTARSDAEDEETRRAAEAERDRVLAERERAQTQRDRALTERDAAIVQRDQAAVQRDQAAVQRDTAIRERDRLASERDQAVAAHAAGLVMRDAVRYSSPPRHERSWSARLVAIAVLVGALIACGIVLRVL